MEGHSVLAACSDEGVPALELRVISNEIEEADRALWRFDDAFAELARVTALVIPELNALLTEIGRP
jgi:futalosine hydrolase